MLVVYELRQAIEKQLNKVGLANRFTRAMVVGKAREFMQAGKKSVRFQIGSTKMVWLNSYW